MALELVEPNGPAVRVATVEEVVLGRSVGSSELVSAGAESDRTAADFVEFYGDSRDRIAGALALTLGDAHLGAEAADEAMARAYQRWDRVGRFDDPAGWVYRVGLNWAISVLRRRRRLVPMVEVDPVGSDATVEPSVAAAMAGLPVGQRAVIVCRYFLGMSEAETSAALHIRPGTVKSRMSRGLQQLQVTLAHLRGEEQS